MPEVISPPQRTREARSLIGPEAKEASERYRRARSKLGELAVDEENGDRIGVIRKITTKSAAKTELRRYRRILEKDRKDRFKEVAGFHKEDVVAAESKIKSAEKGFNSKKRRRLIKEKTTEIHKATNPERTGQGIAGKISDRLNSRANRWEAKQNARIFVNELEGVERAKIPEYDLERVAAEQKRGEALAMAYGDRYNRADRDGNKIPQVYESINQRAKRLPIEGRGREIMTIDRVARQLDRSAEKREALESSYTFISEPDERDEAREAAIERNKAEAKKATELAAARAKASRPTAERTPRPKPARSDKPSSSRRSAPSPSRHGTPSHSVRTPRAAATSVSPGTEAPSSRATRSMEATLGPTPVASEELVDVGGYYSGE